MSDLLSPVLVAVENEVDAYWCFLGLMRNTVFVTSPRDIDMDSQLVSYPTPHLPLLLYPHIHFYSDRLYDYIY